MKKIKSMTVTNQSEQSKLKKDNFYIIRFTRDNLDYKEIENEISIKNISIDFKNKQVTKKMPHIPLTAYKNSRH